MRLAYIIICSALFLAFMLGLRFLMTGISEHFGFGLGIGIFIGGAIGYYAGMTDQKRKASDDL